VDRRMRADLSVNWAACDLRHALLEGWNTMGTADRAETKGLGFTQHDSQSESTHLVFHFENGRICRKIDTSQRLLCASR
jgi:hypothetical protein